MANIYVRSTDGNNADDGSTWALAKADLTGAAAIDSAGDTIFISQSHAETTASALTFNLAGTAASPTRIICGNDAAEPPTSVATTGSISTTGASGITFQAVCAYTYGLVITAGDSTNNASILLTNASGGIHTMESCDLILGGNNSSGRITLSSGSDGRVLLKDCRVKFAHATQGISQATRCGAHIIGGSIISGGTSPTNLFKANGAMSRLIVTGMDMSNGSSTMNLHEGAGGASSLVVFRDCKLPASWSGSLISTTPAFNARYEMYNCDSADTNYRLWIEDYSGSIKSETTIVRSGGASDGTTSLAWKMVTNANANFELKILRSPEIVRWNDTTGSSITVTVEVVHDSQGSGTSSAFTDREIWIEVVYLGTSGVPLGTIIHDAAADVLATAADQASSSVTWTTTGLSTPVKQKLSVSFTPQEKGFIHAVVCMAGASDTCYVDPLLTIS